MKKNRPAYFFGGIAFVLLGIFLPRAWYDALPKAAESLPSPPIKGVTLLQILFVIEGLALIWFSKKRWQFASLQPDQRLIQTDSLDDRQDISVMTSHWILAAITAFALVLRCIHLNADLWLDEITGVLGYGNMPVLHLVTTYTSSNNHLLSTLLMKLTLRIFGEQEWALRLPAMLFGTATIPALYWVSRFTLSRRESLLVALLLATSYHHVFFSQNARGYTAYLLFSILSSGLLLRGLQHDRMRDWVLYIVTTFFNFASLLDAVFVFAAHTIVGAIAILFIKKSGGSPLPLMRRLMAVFTIAGVLVLNLYVTMAPQFYVYCQVVYRDPANGFRPFSAEFRHELTRGISAGFGGGLLLLVCPFLIIVAIGFFVLLKRHWPLILSLTLPGVLTAAFLIVTGLAFSPRFFLLWLPLAMLVAVQGIHCAIGFGSRILGPATRRFTPQVVTIIVLIGMTISLWSLKRYYSVPKQSYRASLEYILAERRPGQPIIAAHLAESGYRFYTRRFGLKEGEDWFPVRSVEALDSVLLKNSGQSPIVVTTFARAMRINYPDLLKRIRDGWTVERVFPATIGDGEISVWKRRADNAQSIP